MNDAAVRDLAQSDPTENLMRHLGEHVEHAKRELGDFVQHVRRLDELRDQLGARGIVVDIDLGPIGNAAAAARRDLERQRDTPTFEMPRV